MKIKKIITLIGFVLVSSGMLDAKMLTYEQIHAMPSSIEKNYFIWRFLSQSSTKISEAKQIIYEVSRLNKKLRVAYKEKTGKRAPNIITKIRPTPDHIWKGRSRGNKYFKKGLAALKKGETQEAASYFDIARKSYTKQYQIDKSLFWLYLSTKNKIYLKYLQKSYSPNIYSLLAADTMNAPYPKTITAQFRKKHKKNFNIQDPISWAKIKIEMDHSSNKMLDKLAEKYASQDCISIYTFIKAQASAYTQSYFPMPYRDTMKHFSPQRQALIYSIARQESRFVPASVSPSFALGMMQFMPFLIEHIAKKKGYTMDLDEMFNPLRSIEFADYHLTYLNKYLHHPLFVAYAYNAGIGFTRKYLRDKKHFRAGPYEPYMSIETMKNVEAREYGKKVLANYVIYLNKLGVPTRITPLIKILANPSKTDCFRK